MSETQEQQTQELDLGLEAITPPIAEIDYEAALAKTKPDFQRMAKLLRIQPTGSTQEEVEADLLAKQQALEEDLKANLVPKVQAALQASLAKISGETSVVTKPGVSVTKSFTEEERKVKAWRGY